MKSIIISLVSVMVMSSVAFAKDKEVTVCGTFDNRPSSGMMAVQVDVLDNVYFPLNLKGKTIELSASGETINEVNRRAELIESLEVGVEVCVTGILKNKKLVPNEIESE